MSFMERIQAHYILATDRINWSKPDHNGVIEVLIGKLSAYVAPLNKEFEWDVSDAETGENIDAGTESTVEKAKQRAEDLLKNNTK